MSEAGGEVALKSRKPDERDDDVIMRLKATSKTLEVPSPFCVEAVEEMSQTVSPAGRREPQGPCDDARRRESIRTESEGLALAQ